LEALTLQIRSAGLTERVFRKATGRALCNPEELLGVAVPEPTLIDEPGKVGASYQWSLIALAEIRYVDDPHLLVGDTERRGCTEKKSSEDFSGKPLKPAKNISHGR